MSENPETVAPAAAPAAPVAPAAPTPTPTPVPDPNAPTPTRDAPESNVEPEDTSKLKRALEAERTARKEAEQRAKAAGDESATKASEAEKRYQETMDKLSTALGFKSEDTPPDPSALQRTIAERDNELGDVKSRIESLTAEKDAAIRERDVELAAWRAAAKQGANAAKLLNLRSFHDVIVGLNPAEDTFAADLDAAVKAALSEDDALRLAALPGAGVAGIGTKGADPFVAVAPGNARIRAAYGSAS